MTNVYQRLKLLDESHDASITSHKGNDNRGATIITLHCPLDYLVAARTVILVEYVKNMAICPLVVLFKFALDVALLVQKIGCFIVT